MSLMAFADEYRNYPAGLQIYTAMNFDKGQGEHYGLQIAIIPYTGGTKILWRSADGPLQIPQVLDCVRNEKSIKLFVPDVEDDTGNWTLLLDGDVIHAIGPRGRHFDLHKTPFK